MIVVIQEVVQGQGQDDIQDRHIVSEAAVVEVIQEVDHGPEEGPYHGDEILDRSTDLLTSDHIAVAPIHLHRHHLFEYDENHLVLLLQQHRLRRSQMYLNVAVQFLVLDPNLC